MFTLWTAQRNDDNDKRSGYNLKWNKIQERPLKQFRHTFKVIEGRTMKRVYKTIMQRRKYNKEGQGERNNELREMLTKV